MADSTDVSTDDRPPPVPKDTLSPRPTTLKEAEDILTWLGGRQVFLRGFSESLSNLNDEICRCMRYSVEKQVFEVQLGSSNPPKKFCVPVGNISMLTESERERILKQYPERALQEQFRKARMVDESKRLARGPTSFSDPRKSKKNKGRGGINPGMCLCCDKPMDDCSSDPEAIMLEGHGSMVAMLAKDGGRGMDGNSINGLCSFLIEDGFMTGYGSILGCECEAWRLMPISKRFPHNVEDCVHAGNDPLSPILAEIYNANVAEATLKVAWRKDEATRFAAVELFMLLVASSPPPMYIFTPEFPQYVSQLTQTLAAGKTDVCMAAQYAVMEIYRCACNSRPCDWNISTFRNRVFIPFEDAALSGRYRQLFERRQGPFKDLYQHISFWQIHERRVLMMMQCDECGKEEKSTAKLFGCSLCAQCFYCNKECQTKHWKSDHKKVCKQLVGILKTNKALGWEPSTTKLICRTCGFGPASKHDVQLHADSTKHDIYRLTPKLLEDAS